MSDDQHLKRLNRILPVLAVGLALFAFVAIYMAGHDAGTALLVAGLMVAFVIGTYLIRRFLGPRWFFVVLVCGGMLAWLSSGLGFGPK